MTAPGNRPEVRPAAGPQLVDPQQAESVDLAALYGLLNSRREGLGEDEVRRRQALFGPNELAGEKQTPLRQLLGYFWGPIPWMIEAAAILSGMIRHWVDLAIIGVMLVFNAVVGFWQEHQAANALDALKAQLALKARALRDGKWQVILARDLVPGDIIRLRLGDIIPADVKLTEGEYLSVDQSALTGESLPVEKEPGAVAYSGSVAKQGEMVALVTGTGANTYFARTARLVEKAGAVSHFQKAVLTIGDYLIYLSLLLAAVLVIAQIIRGDAFLTVFQFVLILVVAAIPVAMPAVLSVTMALGALTLSKMKAIVARLQSIEEIAGIDILCSDKTGTLTQNKLTIGEPVAVRSTSPDEVILAAALASEPEDQDAIDLAVIGGLHDQAVLSDYTQENFIPFDPVRKRTEATVRDARGRVSKITKGAPQVIFQLAGLQGQALATAERQVDDLAARGYRTLGVARTSGTQDAWEYLGIIPLFDPPREDSAETVQRAAEHGITVKMVTGDNVAIAREIARQLGLSPSIRSADDLFAGMADRSTIDRETEAVIEQADGFAQVFPEHKYAIVKALQNRDHFVAMTGDGVNDAPALKQAEVGIAVSGATDAARAAASLVLTAPGLSVIIRAVEEARRIFERMNSYAIYRITETIRVMFFVVLAMVVFNFYPITTVMIILLALLNDLPIMTIAYDKTRLAPKPVRWNMRRVLTLSTVMGLIGVVETFGILLIGKLLLRMTPDALQSFIYLKLAVAGHLTLLVVRTRKPFLSRPHPAGILLGAILGTQIIAALIVGIGILVTPIPWSYIGFIWVYCLAWAFVEDYAKLHVYHHLALSGSRHRKFLDRVQGSLHPLQS